MQIAVITLGSAPCSISLIVLAGTPDISASLLWVMPMAVRQALTWLRICHHLPAFFPVSGSLLYQIEGVFP